MQVKKHDEDVALSKAYEQITEYKKKITECKKKVDGDGYTNLYWIIYSSPEEQELDIDTIEDYDDEIRIISGLEFAGMLMDVGLQGMDEAF